MFFKLTSASGPGGFDVTRRDDKNSPKRECKGYATIKSVNVFFNKEDSNFVVQIDSLEALMNFIKEVENYVIISDEEITIYDDYIE